MREYLELSVLVAKDGGEEFTEDEAFDILVDACVFIDGIYHTTSTGTVVIKTEDELDE